MAWADVLCTLAGWSPARIKSKALEAGASIDALPSGTTLQVLSFVSLFNIRQLYFIFMDVLLYRSLILRTSNSNFKQSNTPKLNIKIQVRDYKFNANGQLV